MDLFRKSTWRVMHSSFCTEILLTGNPSNRARELRMLRDHKHHMNMPLHIRLAAQVSHNPVCRPFPHTQANQGITMFTITQCSFAVSLIPVQIVRCSYNVAYFYNITFFHSVTLL